jgi:iron complex transport system substrate-binding protein
VSQVKKPAHQWETRLGQAFRQAGPVPGFADDTRAEAFALRFHDGRVGQLRLGLARQEADPEAARDPDLVHAVKAWLAARGQRTIQLVQGERVLASGPFAVRDLGDDVPAPHRLITLCPSNAELVHALGSFDRVIACEDSSDYPPEVTERERLGPDLGPDLDRVAALAPALAVSSLTVPGMERVVTGLRARGVPQAVLAPRSIADVLDEARWLSAQLGVPAHGAALVAEMQRQMA